MSTSSPEESDDWTFSYKLSRPVYCKESIDDNTIKFVKDSGNNLIGFKIEVKYEIESKGRETSKIKAKKLEKILTIMSGMELKAVLADLERLPKKSVLRRVYKDFIVKYDIDGSIDKVDITDSNVTNIINKDVNNELDYLSDAVAHKYHGRYSEAIAQAFKVIEGKNYPIMDYNKYKCIRDILSHREDQELYPNTRKYFTCSFKPVGDKFDFKYCDENNGKFIFDFDSPKTKKTLEQVTDDLIRDVKGILRL